MKYPEQESAVLEFKAAMPKNDQIIKTVVGFCNQKGGKILIGVDNAGVIVGISDEDIARYLEYLDKSIYESISPPVIPQIYVQRVGDKAILVVQVYPGSQKPYYVRSQGLENGVYVRLGRSTVRATADMIEELALQSRGQEYDELPVYHAGVEDLDQGALREFFFARRHASFVPQDMQEALHAYGFTTRDFAHVYPTVGGMLLFGSEPRRFFPEAHIICTRFKGTEGRDVSSTKDCHGTLFKQFEEAYTFVSNSLQRSFTIRGKERIEQLEVPEVALREAIVNGIIHRNYRMKCPIKIAVYDDRIEVFSPGTMPGPLHASMIQEGYTFVRNSIIVRAFRETGYAEKLGTGIAAIFKSYKEAGLAVPQILELDGFVKYILPRAGRTHEEPAYSVEDKVLHLFGSTTELSISDIVALTSLPRSTVGRKLKELVKSGILKKVGTARSTRYILTKHAT